VRTWHAVLLVVAFVLGATGAHGAPVRVPGGQWRSVLPVQTKQGEVSVAPFLLEPTPVTNADFLEFVRLHPQWQRGRAPKTLADSGYLRHWSGPLTLGATAQPNQPVTAVSWFAARAFCEARGERLPTWYEWELAAAADEDEADARKQVSWQQRILSWYSRPSGRALEAVGTGRPNVYGVHDLHGLVWEWVEDFNALMISGDSREQGDPDLLKYCGSGALAIEDRESYAVMMRLAMLSSLEANATTINLGFRCAKDDEGARP
jgi:formylglycine-generating enzyme